VANSVSFLLAVSRKSSAIMKRAPPNRIVTASMALSVQQQTTFNMQCAYPRTVLQKKKKNNFERVSFITEMFPFLIYPVPNLLLSGLILQPILK
jgi:hypothetical protein